MKMGFARRADSQAAGITRIDTCCNDPSAEDHQQKRTYVRQERAWREAMKCNPEDRDQNSRWEEPEAVHEKRIRRPYAAECAHDLHGMVVIGAEGGTDQDCGREECGANRSAQKKDSHRE